MESVDLGKLDDPVEDAEGAVEELRTALADRGVLLPSLGVDVVWLGSRWMPPLVDLGCCKPSVARKLAAALRSAARER